MSDVNNEITLLLALKEIFIASPTLFLTETKTNGQQLLSLENTDSPSKSNVLPYLKNIVLPLMLWINMCLNLCRGMQVEN